MAKMVALCLDRWAAIQVEEAMQEPSASRSPISTLPQASTSISLLTEPSVGTSDSPSTPLPSPAIHDQQPEPPTSPLSNLRKAGLRRPAPGLANIANLAHNAPFLIVDDNDVNLKLLSAYLARKSYPFMTAVDGIVAVEAYKAARGNFSCIFMDIQMPRMDGITATRLIREYERKHALEAVTVVALTGLATEEKQKEAEGSGINEFFAKPVRLKALDVILERTARPIA
jgi:CheY-like chemotaxis protein